MKCKINYLLIIFLLSLLTFSGCTFDQDDGLNFGDVSAIQEPIAVERNDINKLIMDISTQKGNDFDWRGFSDEQLWAAYKFSDNMTIVGWKEEGTTTSQRKEILDFVRKSEGITSDEDLIIEEFKNLQILVLKVAKKETLLGLKKMKSTANLFEIGYSMLSKEDLEALNQAQASKSFAKANTVASKSTIVKGINIDYPSRFDNHGIKSAWHKGLSGKNIGIAIIDNGVLRNDPIFGEAYRNNINGLNPNDLKRNYNRSGFFRWNWYWGSFDGDYVQGFNPTSRDHGTKMAQTAAGPMGKGNNKLTGVSYASNIRAVRAVYSVFIVEPAAMLSVARAYDFLADRNDVNIISMSLGGPYKSWTIERAIKRCTDKGKLVFNAGGTLVKNQAVTSILLAALGKDRNFTAFPASMNETISCTGIIKTTQQYCDACFGSVDFVTEFKDTDEERSSSYATSTTAGIAGLIWGVDPTKSAAQVLNEMKAIAVNKTRTAAYGYGAINMANYKPTTNKRKIVQIRKYHARNFALDGNWGGRNGQNIYLWDTNQNNVNQQWIEINRGSGYYSYQKMGTNKCIDSNGSGNGKNVYLWDCNDNNYNQHFKKVATNRGRTHMLLKRNAIRYAIDGNSGGRNGQNVHMWDANTRNGNQQWVISQINNLSRN